MSVPKAIRWAGGVVLFVLLGVPLRAESSEWAGTPQEGFLKGPIVAKYQCTTCHTITETGGTVGPILNFVGLRREEEWLRRWLDDPQAVKPGTKMPKFDFTAEELGNLVDTLSRMTKIVDSERILTGPGSLAEKGERLFRTYDCLACHRIGKEGRFVGPDLTWLALRKTKAWERAWLKDPPAFKPGTFMPDFHLSPEQINAVTAYLEGLRGQMNEDSQSWEFMVNMFLNNKAPRRGELVFKRFACWSCHGEDGRGGIRNPNAAPDETIPPLIGAALDYRIEGLKALLARRRQPEARDSGLDPPPFYCPDYSGAIADQEFEDLHAYLGSLAPKGGRWKIR